MHTEQMSIARAEGLPLQRPHPPRERHHLEVRRKDGGDYLYVLGVALRRVWRGIASLLVECGQASTWPPRGAILGSRAENLPGWPPPPERARSRLKRSQSGIWPSRRVADQPRTRSRSAFTSSPGTSLTRPSRTSCCRLSASANHRLSFSASDKSSRLSRRARARAARASRSRLSACSLTFSNSEPTARFFDRAKKHPSERVAYGRER